MQTWLSCLIRIWLIVSESVICTIRLARNFLLIKMVKSAWNKNTAGYNGKSLYHQTKLIFFFNLDERKRQSKVHIFYTNFISLCISSHSRRHLQENRQNIVSAQLTELQLVKIVINKTTETQGSSQKIKPNMVCWVLRHAFIFVQSFGGHGF